MIQTKLSKNTYLISGAVNTCVLVRNNKALLIDCCDLLTLECLSQIGVDTVDMIFFTQHRRTHTAGVYQILNTGTRIFVPIKERHLFENPEANWEDPVNRWHVYHYQPGPLVMIKSLPVSGVVCEGDFIEWEGLSIEVLDSPGATDGSVSYVVRDDDKTICFSGDVIYGNGQIFDLYSLQKGFTERDYHGFIGNIKKLIPSMQKIKALNADLLVPSHGDIISNPSLSITIVMELLEKLYENYYSITSIKYYFPDYLNESRLYQDQMETSVCINPPDFIKHIEFTSYVLVSDTGSALLIDCGDDGVVDFLKNWIQERIIKSIDLCWITHYHDDHVDALNRLISEFSCKIVTNELVAEIIENPLAFFLPCVSQTSAIIDLPLSNGTSWKWNEFSLTAFHFPGQTFFHSGLLVEGHNKKLFFAGDSFSPNGIDDYCCGNRNFVGEGKGYRNCIDILRMNKPDYIFNQHLDKAFKFSDFQLDYMELKLKEREKILAKILPWNNPNFGLDEWWVRTYPYEQEAIVESLVTIEVHFTNHDIIPVDAIAQPMLPEEWEAQNKPCTVEITVAPQTFGSANERYVNPDGKAVFQIKIPGNISAKRYIIPFRITWDGRYLGQFRHAIVLIKEK